jgi:hypothetical protein
MNVVVGINELVPQSPHTFDVRTPPSTVVVNVVQDSQKDASGGVVSVAVAVAVAIVVAADVIRGVGPSPPGQ